MVLDLAGVDRAEARRLSQRYELKANETYSKLVGDEVVLVDSGEIIVCDDRHLEGVFEKDQAFNAFRGQGVEAPGYRILAATDATIRVFSRSDFDELVEARPVGAGGERRQRAIEARVRAETEHFRRLRASADFIFQDHEALLSERRPYIVRVRSQVWPVSQQTFQPAPNLWGVSQSYFVLQHLVDIGPEETGARFSFRQAAIWQAVVHWRWWLPLVTPVLGLQLHAAWEDSVMALQISRELGNYPTRLGQVLMVDGGRRHIVLVDGEIIFSGPNLQFGRPAEPPESSRTRRSLRSMIPEFPIPTFAWHQEPMLGPAGTLMRAWHAHARVARPGSNPQEIFRRTPEARLFRRDPMTGPWARRILVNLLALRSFIGRAESANRTSSASSSARSPASQTCRTRNIDECGAADRTPTRS